MRASLRVQHGADGSIDRARSGDRIRVRRRRRRPRRPPYDVSGTIVAAAGSAIDSDTNDPSAPFTPQRLRGARRRRSAIRSRSADTLNEPGAGPPARRPGARPRRATSQDWFRVSIASGPDDPAPDRRGRHRQRSRSRAAPARPDARREQRDDGRTEEIAVADSGDYYVVVTSPRASRTTRSRSGRRRRARAPAREPEFVPGPGPRALPRRSRPVARASGRARARSVGMRHVSGEPDGPMLFAAETVAERRAAFEALGLALTPEMRGAPDSRGERSLRDDTRQIAAALRRRPEVRSADLNYVRTASAVPDRRVLSRSSGTTTRSTSRRPGTSTGAEQRRGRRGARHGREARPPRSRRSARDRLRLHLRHRHRERRQRLRRRPRGSRRQRARRQQLSRHPRRRHGGRAHLVLVRRRDRRRRAWRGTRGSCRCACSAWAAAPTPTSWRRCAMRRAARPTCAGAGAATPARIVNMSLSGPGLQPDVPGPDHGPARRTEGMIFVAAAGNGASSQPQYPAAFAGVISVSAVGPTRSLAPYSNFGGDDRRGRARRRLPARRRRRRLSRRRAQHVLPGRTRLRLCVLPGHLDGRRRTWPA